jgi:hypothetical protein
MARDPRIALEDMVVAIDRIAEETEKLTCGQFAENWRAQYIVERAIPESSFRHPQGPRSVDCRRPALAA